MPARLGFPITYLVPWDWALRVFRSTFAINRLVPLRRRPLTGLSAAPCTTGSQLPFERRPPLNRNWMLSQLRQVRDDLVSLVATMEEVPAVDQAAFAEVMEDVYQHLNTAWNSRNASEDELDAVAGGAFEDWARMPSDFVLSTLGSLQYVGPSKDVSDHPHLVTRDLVRPKATGSKKRPRDVI